MHLTGARFAQPFRRVREHLARSVVDIAFQAHHGTGVGGIDRRLSFRNRRHLGGTSSLFVRGGRIEGRKLVNQHGAQDARPLVHALARADTHLLHAKPRRKLEPRCNCRNDSSARRRHKLPLDAANGKRQAVLLNDVQGGRHRHRNDAVLTANGAAPVYQLRHEHAIDTQIVEEHRRGHDVYDGVDSADLVEMDLVERHAVGFRLSMRKNIHDAVRKRFGAFGKRARINHRIDIGGTTVRVMMAVMMVGLTVVVVIALMAMAMLCVMPMPFCMVHLMMVGVLMVMAILAIMLMQMIMAVQVSHIVIMVFVQGIEHYVEIAAIEARLAHAAHAQIVATKRKRRECCAQTLLAGTKV